MSKMKLNQAFYTALDRVEVAKSRILALHYAFYPLRSAGRFSGEPKKEFSALHALLYEQLNDAFRALLMFADFVGPEKHDAARLAAAKHYLNEKSSIMQYLGFDGEYGALDDSLFREEIKQALEKPDL